MEGKNKLITIWLSVCSLCVIFALVGLNLMHQDSESNLGFYMTVICAGIGSIFNGVMVYMISKR